MKASVPLAGECSQGLSRALERLLQFLGQYSARIPQEDLLEVIQTVAMTVEDVLRFRRFHEHQYARNLICRAPHYEVFCMCWHSGQRSPIHDHHLSSCAIQVLEGMMTNIDYELLPSGFVRPIGSHELAAGELDVRSDASIHQVANLQAVGRDLVTLHVYSPPLCQMNLFSLEATHPLLAYFPPEICFAGEGI